MMLMLCRRTSVEKDFSFSMSSRRRSGTPAGVTRMGSITAQQRAPFPEASYLEQQTSVLVGCCPVRQPLPSCSSSAAWRGALGGSVLPAVANCHEVIGMPSMLPTHVAAAALA